MKDIEITDESCSTVVALKVCRCSPIKDFDIAMEFYLKKNEIKLSVEYLYIIIYENTRVIVFVRSFPKPTARLQEKKRERSRLAL